MKDDEKQKVFDEKILDAAQQGMMEFNTRTSKWQATKKMVAFHAPKIERQRTEMMRG